MDPVQDQLDAYNVRDWSRFVAAYSLDIVIEDGDGNRVVEGHVQLRERYQSLFQASPALHCHIAHRTTIGKYVMDEEEIAGWRGMASTVRTVVVYRVEEDKIVHVWMFR
jgi:hypothetical protein